MSALSIIMLVLRAVGAIAGYLKDNQLIDAGQQKEIAASLARIAQRAGVARQVAEETAAMTDDEIDEELMQ